MSRSKREAQLEALFGDRYPAVLVSRMGSRKRDRKRLLGEQLEGSYKYGSLPGMFAFGGPAVNAGTIRSSAPSRTRQQVPPPSRQIQQAPPTRTSSRSAPVQTATRQPAWAALTTQGAPKALQGLMNVDERYMPPALRGMSSMGSLGNMFAGSSAGPGGNPFDVSGSAMASGPRPTMASAPGAGYGAVKQAAPQAPATRGPDFHGLKTPGMGAMKPYAPTGQAAPPQRAPLPPLPMGGPGPGWTTSAPQGPGYVAPGDYGQDPMVGGLSVQQRMNIARGLSSPPGWQAGGLPGLFTEAARRGQAKQFMGPVQLYTPPTGYKEGTLPSYAGGTITARLPEGISYAQALDELIMGPSIDEADKPEYAHYVRAGEPDKALHAAFFGNLARGLGGGRVGAELSNAAGFAREGLQGVGNVLTGGKFVGPGGFDPYDIRANMLGIDLATRKPRSP